MQITLIRPFFLATTALSVWSPSSQFLVFSFAKYNNFNNYKPSPASSSSPHPHLCHENRASVGCMETILVVWDDPQVMLRCPPEHYPNLNGFTEYDDIWDNCMQNFSLRHLDSNVACWRKGNAHPYTSLSYLQLMILITVCSTQCCCLVSAG